MKTLTQLENELSEIRKGVAKGQYQKGMFGLEECKKSIQWEMDFFKKDLCFLYTNYVTRGLNETGFNLIKIVACEEMMKEVRA